MAAQEFWAQAFMGLVLFLASGLLWFWVVRPIVTDLQAWWVEHRYVEDAPLEHEADPVHSAAFTNTGTSGSTAAEPAETERTPEPPAEPGVQIATLEGVDLQHIVDALERRGYLCLSPAEMGIARDLVYHTERAARFDPASDRSKSAVIERATGLKRGGSKDYQRASRVYDSVIGKPPPAVANLMQQDAKSA